MRPLRFLRFYLTLGLCYLAAIIGLSLAPLKAQGPQIPHVDKAVHLLAYFLLMAWFGQLALDPRLRTRWALAFIALGAVLELLQGWGGLRQAEWQDALANALGVVLGAWLSIGSGGALLKRFESKYI